MNTGRDLQTLLSWVAILVINIADHCDLERTGA